MRNVTGTTDPFLPCGCATLIIVKIHAFCKQQLIVWNQYSASDIQTHYQLRKPILGNQNQFSETETDFGNHW